MPYSQVDVAVCTGKLSLWAHTGIRDTDVEVNSVGLAEQMFLRTSPVMVAMAHISSSSRATNSNGL